MNIGVIGGSGYIGSHIVDKLIDAGHEVTIFDIMLPHRSDVRHLYIDITDLSKTSVAMTGNYDAIYMLAAMANVNDVYRNPVEAGQVNIMGVANVLEAARRNMVPRVILSSTVWVYEMANSKMVDEDAALAPAKAKHIYTASKVAAELYCHAYKNLFSKDFTILRYGIPYGPRARQGTVIANFVARALKNEPLTIQGDGMQYRNFIYVEDLAEGNVAALNAKAANRTYNLDGPRSVTIKELAETVKKLIGNVTIEYKEARPGDYGGATVSSARVEQELGWKPKVDLEEGLRRYIEWYKGAKAPRVAR
ncbi:MAG: NAD-dependent epimerase/dehydratase family protein [Chloroflexi bacterium]|nr:NAD-dependent epimerase/dehydratase family protein [Chloroflexota bacterium]